MAVAILGFRRRDLNASLLQQAFSQYTNLHRKSRSSRAHSSRQGDRVFLSRTNMSDTEETPDAPVAAETAAPAPGEPMDVNSAVKLVLKKALAHDGLCRGLRETTRAIEKDTAQLCILAEDCDQPDYKKLVEALCAEKQVHLLSVPEAKQLGQWAGLCKIDQEGEARKVVGCSSVVVTDYGEETEGHSVLQEFFKNK